MSFRTPAGFISASFDPLKNPNAPTIGAATGSNVSASVAFTAPANVGGSAITAYYAVSDPGQITTSGASSPITATGLTNGTAYTFQVWALNSYGPGVWSAASGSVIPNPTRGLFGGGGYPEINTIQYINIESTGNSTFFGQLTTVNSFYNMACSSSTRGVFAGGSNGGSTYSNVMSYVTIASAGNATSFGALLSTVSQGGGGCSNSTRGLFSAGRDSSAFISSSIQYITIATTGNGTNFGNLTFASSNPANLANTTRAIIMRSGSVATTEYVTIATTGNGTNFGNMDVPRSEGSAGCASATLGFFTGAGSPSSISYCTIATTGSFSSFGDLSTRVQGNAAVTNSTRAVFGGGYPSTGTIQYITMTSTGNSATFGTMVTPSYGVSGCSSGHGGL